MYPLASQANFQLFSLLAFLHHFHQGFLLFCHQGNHHVSLQGSLRANRLANLQFGQVVNLPDIQLRNLHSNRQIFRLDSQVRVRLVSRQCSRPDNLLLFLPGSRLFAPRLNQRDFLAHSQVCNRRHYQQCSRHDSQVGNQVRNLAEHRLDSPLGSHRKVHLGNQADCLHRNHLFVRRAFPLESHHQARLYSHQASHRLSRQKSHHQSHRRRLFK